jgi:hypothetical protein
MQNAPENACSEIVKSNRAWAVSKIQKLRLCCCAGAQNGVSAWKNRVVAVYLERIISASSSGVRVIIDSVSDSESTRVSSS